jgi:FAD/FMN-containing dehydrogenase
MAALISSGHDVNYSHRVFATPRAVRFQEMEYSLPVDALPEVVTAIDRIIRDNKLNIHFPVECRFVRGDDIALSPAHGRDSAYIAVHTYKDMPRRDYFDAVEAVFRQHEGRPHWGKLHTATPDELRARYPQWDSFQSVRQRLDPDGVFLNPYLRGLFGIEKA